MTEREHDDDADDEDLDHWAVSTEGDLDPDLTEEAGSGMEDWDRPFEMKRGFGAARIAIALALIALVLSVVVRAF